MGEVGFASCARFVRLNASSDRRNRALRTQYVKLRNSPTNQFAHHPCAKHDPSTRPSSSQHSPPVLATGVSIDRRTGFQERSCTS